MQKAKRIILCKGGLDGHTTGIVLLAKALRDAGFEVIYLGIYQAPSAIARAACDEDADAIAVSIHSGAHLEVFKDLMRRLKRDGGDRLVVAGGIIPPQDHAELKKLGVRAIFMPGSSLERDIVPFFKKELKRHPPEYVALEYVQSLHDGMRKGDRRALARYITYISYGWSSALQMFPRKPVFGTHVIGFTGFGGAGKSSLIAHLVGMAYRDERVAAILVDPPSRSGGVVLGDRIRLHRPESIGVITSDNVFVRSIAAHEVWHGASRETQFILQAAAYSGFPTIFLESVGVGQYDTRFKDLTDTLVAVAHPSMGDEVQMLKGGMLESADIIVLNQYDDPRAEKSYADLKKHYATKRSDSWHVPVIKTVAASGISQGIDRLWLEIQHHKEFKNSPRKKA